MIDINIDREIEKPLYAQIRDALMDAIKNDDLQPGEQLPTVVALASRIGVTQGTVRRAFEDLAKAGLLISQVGRGTFIARPEETEQIRLPGGPSERPAWSAPLDADSRSAARHLRMSVAQGLENLLALHNRPGLIKFTSGVPAPVLARAGVLEYLTQEALKEGQGLYLGCSDPLGLPGLRQEVAELFRQRGAEISPDQVLITNGSQQALSLAALTALQDGRRIICETPCYTGIPTAFSAFGHWVESAPRDLEGPIMDRLDRFADGRPSLLYLCPQLHNPMGSDLSPERRRLLLEWARNHKVQLISDEIFHDLRFDGPAVTSLLAEKENRDIMVTGSISKAFTVGLRIGWLITDSERVRTIASLKKAMDLGTPYLMQGLARELFRTGEYEAHLVRVREQYRLRRDAVVKALQIHMPEEIIWSVPAGGFNMWVQLPPGYSSIVLFLLAVERGVSFIPGPYMDVDHRFINAFRLSYGDLDIEMIKEGVELLASAVKEMLRQKPNDPGLSGLGDFL